MTPTTKAGRALLAESEGNAYEPGERELFLDDILAIEREAAQKERERLLRTLRSEYGPTRLFEEYGDAIIAALRGQR